MSPTHERAVCVIGAGGHAKVLIDTLQACRAKIFGLVDSDSTKHGGSILGVKVLGDDGILNDAAARSVVLANGIGSVGVPIRRRDIYNQFAARGFAIRTLVHPSAIIAADVVLDIGAQIMAGAILQPGVRVGANSIVNTRASLDHDCLVGDHVHIAPGVTLSGDVSIGAMSHVGVGATVTQGIRIGQGCVVRAGAVVIADVPDGAVVGGIPARTQ